MYIKIDKACLLTALRYINLMIPRKAQGEISTCTNQTPCQKTNNQSKYNSNHFKIEFLNFLLSFLHHQIGAKKRFIRIFVELKIREVVKFQSDASTKVGTKFNVLPENIRDRATQGVQVKNQMD